MEAPWERKPDVDVDDDNDLPTHTGGMTRTGSGSGGGGAPDAPPLEVGTDIGGYRIVELIGEGGMGRVYLAEHARLGRRVALKVLRRRYDDERDTVRRFFEEARAVNRIKHDHIIEVHDFLEPDDGSSCYVMELLEGQTLAGLLKSQGHLTTPVAVRVGAQIASALGAAHEEGIVHRDLKPDNIFLTERAGQTDFVKLLDFGVAKLETTDDVRVMGTPAYMAPEQLEGQLVDHRADVYAFGVVMYQLLSGKRPFTGRSAGELLLKHATEPPQPLRETTGPGATVPRELDGLVMRCLSKSRDNRPASMEEVEQALNRLVKPEGRPRVRSTILAAFLVVSFIGGAYAIGRGTSESEVAAVPSTVTTTPAPPEEVELSFRSTPPGATVSRLGTEEVLGVTPFSLRVPGAAGSGVFLFALETHGSNAASVSLMSDGEVSVTFGSPVTRPDAVATEPPTQPESDGAKPAKPQATRRKPTPSPTPSTKPVPKPAASKDGRAVIMDPFADG